MALQLAVRVERLDPPTVRDLCEAAALATIALLDDSRTGPGEPWHDAVAAWNGARIRKIVRRGRASAWERAQDADGVTVIHRSAEVRAFVPGPLDRAPAPVAKLQIRSTPLDEPVLVDELPPVGADHPELLIAVTPEVDMSWGKQAAQCAHAGQLAWQGADHDRAGAWNRAGRPIQVVHPDRARWAELVAQADVTVHDGGFTEIPAGTLTAVALWRGRQGGEE